MGGRRRQGIFSHTRARPRAIEITGVIAGAKMASVMGGIT
jgi:hypothetical protein